MNDNSDPYASVLRVLENIDSMTMLRNIFPNGNANPDNFALFSTGGTHGTYGTIEDVEKEVQAGSSVNGLTFLIIHPRIVCMRYGQARPETPEDFDFLREVRKTSQEVVAKIGYGNYPIAT